MKLFYYKDEVGNFGDDLNPWLWDQLLPSFFDDDDSELLVGIGTLLNHKLPLQGKKYVLGSGYGYGEPPAIDDSFHFFAVRGPKTAKVLGIDPKLAITDPAILLRAVDLPIKSEKQYKMGFIPHYQSTRYFSWSRICEQLGYNYINPEWSVDKVLEELSLCETVMCEAMHGAITCDALRIPWIPIRCYDYISSFKWQDWLMTINLPYNPVSVASIYDREKRMSGKLRYKNKFKRFLIASGIWQKKWDMPAEADSPISIVNQAAEDLLVAAKSSTYLSKENDCNRLTEQYVDIIEKVKLLR